MFVDPNPAGAAAGRIRAAICSKKRKTGLAEIEVDLSQPEPPSKKALRNLKKGKPAPSKAHSSSGGIESDEENDEADARKQGGTVQDAGKKNKKRSLYGVWIGNLPFAATKKVLRAWLTEGSGGVIVDEAITRVHMPGKDDGRGKKKKATEEWVNRGFAYVNFSMPEASAAAQALSETELEGRKLLIKDAESFEGRPAKVKNEMPEPEPVMLVRTNGEEMQRGRTLGKEKSQTAKNGASVRRTPSKIFVGNLSFDTTKEDLQTLFEKCGPIGWIKIAEFEDSGKCKGYAWVNFEGPDAAAWAVKGFVKTMEEVETEDDFVDNEKKDAEKEDEDGKKERHCKRRTETRKWWVNRLHGRPLKIELAEDDQTRYKKRFKSKPKQLQLLQGGMANWDGHNKQRNQQQHRLRNNRVKGQGKRELGVEVKDGEAKEARKILASHDETAVARLTGAIVAPQGKKTTFD